MVPFETDELAREAVAKGEVWGMAIVPETFTKYFLKRLWSSLDVDNETLVQSSIQVQSIKFIFFLEFVSCNVPILVCSGQFGHV